MLMGRVNYELCHYSLLFCHCKWGSKMAGFHNESLDRAAHSHLISLLCVLKCSQTISDKRSIKSLFMASSLGEIYLFPIFYLRMTI